MYTSKDSIPVVIVTLTHRIEGDLHVLAGSRLTDALNSKSKDYLAVTNAKIFSPTECDQQYEAEYIAVNRDAISFIFPLKQ